MFPRALGCLGVLDWVCLGAGGLGVVVGGTLRRGVGLRLPGHSAGIEPWAQLWPGEGVGLASDTESSGATLSAGAHQGASSRSGPKVLHVREYVRAVEALLRFLG